MGEGAWQKKKFKFKFGAIFLKNSLPIGIPPAGCPRVRKPLGGPDEEADEQGDDDATGTAPILRCCAAVAAPFGPGGPCSAKWPEILGHENFWRACQKNFSEGATESSEGLGKKNFLKGLRKKLRGS